MTLDDIYKLGPVVTFSTLFIGYIIWIFQKRYEAKLAFYKNVRFACSNFLLIWKEFSILESRLKSKDDYDKILFKYPGLAKKYFKIDHKKVKQLNKDFEDSLDAIKSINVDLFYRLSNNFDDFNGSIDNILIPMVNDQSLNEKHKDEIIIPLLDETLKDMEVLIKELSKQLPWWEKSKILSHIEKHKINLISLNNQISIPDFVMNFINKSLPVKEPFTKDEILLLYNNPTVTRIISKINLNFIVKIIGNSPLKIIKFISNIQSENTTFIQEIENKIDSIEIILKLELDDEDIEHLKDNNTFYLIFIGAIKKIAGHVPFDLKRYLVKMNNGTIDIRDDLKKLKDALIEYQKENQINIDK